MLLLLGTTLTASFFDSLNPSAIAQQLLLQAMVKRKRHVLFFILGIGLANLLLGLGVMLAAGEVPRIAQQFGLDSSVKVNMMSVVHATSTAVNMTRNIARSL